MLPSDVGRAGSVAREIDRLEKLVGLMDDRFTIPGTTIRFGLDPLLGLLPGAGDLVAAAVAVYMIGRARSLGVPKRGLVRMAVNVAIDALLGSVPLVGDLFDVTFRANRRNMDVIRRHVAGR